MRPLVAPIIAPIAPILAALAVCAVAAPARADDAKAQEKLQAAYAHWKDDTPDAALALAQEALAETGPTSNRLVRGQVLLFIGSLHQVKTGRLDLALAAYDELITLLGDASSDAARRLAAQALVRKGNIIYAEKDDFDGAIELYRRAQELVELASTADTASQLCYRHARAAERTPEERARDLDMALALSREALDLAPRHAQPGAKLDKFMAKFRLQLCLVLEAQGKKDEADAEWRDVHEADLDENALYQRALREAVHGDLAKAGQLLREALALRPTSDTRNQLRKFIRTEPDLQPGLARDDWKDVVTDEPPGRGPAAPAAPPASEAPPPGH
jgi:tetratricopeptide (TPR) repeat protein